MLVEYVVVTIQHAWGVIINPTVSRNTTHVECVVATIQHARVGVIINLTARARMTRVECAVATTQRAPVRLAIMGKRAHNAHACMDTVTMG